MNNLLKAALEKKIVKSLETNQYYNVYKEHSCFKISRVGGGFVHTVNSNDAHKFEIVDALPNKYVAGVMSLDIPEFEFEGYCIPENRWNGWAIPVFTVDVAKKIAQMVNEIMEDEYLVTRNDEQGYFEVKDFNWESTEKLEDFIINVDGQDIVVVGFMGANWTWDVDFGDCKKTSCDEE